MDNRKAKILETLDGFVNSRPGLDPADYGCNVWEQMNRYFVWLENWRGYRREAASITRDRSNYYAIRKQISWRDSVSADAILKAAEHAFSGRLTITEDGDKVTIDYCVGQYFPTEYRKAACAVLASAWWSVTREDCPDFETDTKGSFVGSNPGEWMRDTAKRTFGLSLQRGYFH